MGNKKRAAKRNLAVNMLSDMQRQVQFAEDSSNAEQLSRISRVDGPGAVPTMRRGALMRMDTVSNLLDVLKRPESSEQSLGSSVAGGPAAGGGEGVDELQSLLAKLKQERASAVATMRNSNKGGPVGAPAGSRGTQLGVVIDDEDEGDDFDGADALDDLLEEIKEEEEKDFYAVNPLPVPVSVVKVTRTAAVSSVWDTRLQPRLNKQIGKGQTTSKLRAPATAACAHLLGTPYKIHSVKGRPPVGSSVSSSAASSSASASSSSQSTDPASAAYSAVAAAASIDAVKSSSNDSRTSDRSAFDPASPSTLRPCPRAPTFVPEVASAVAALQPVSRANRLALCPAIRIATYLWRFSNRLFLNT